MVSIDRKFLIFIVPLLLMLGMLVTVAIVVNNTNEAEKAARADNPSQSYVDLSDEEVDQDCPTAKSYCVFEHDQQKYLILNNTYSGDHDIKYFAVTKTDASSIPAYSYLNYDEYHEFSQKYKLEEKYTSSSSHYIVYFYNSGLIAPDEVYNPTVYNSLYVKLGEVKYESDRATLYVWNNITDLGGVYQTLPGSQTRTKAYAIIIPTNYEVNDFRIKELIHRTEYNKIAKVNPMDGYSYSPMDNAEIVKNMSIGSKNEQFNTIVSNSLSALAKERTVKIATTRNEFPTPVLYSYIDLINSVAKIQTGTKAIHYNAFTDDLALNFSLYGGAGEYASSTSSVVDRSALFKSIFNNFSDIDIFDQNADYKLSISKDSDSYTVKLSQSSATGSAAKKTTTIQFNKRTFLPMKTITKTGTNVFTYTNDNIALPDDIDYTSHQAQIN